METITITISIKPMTPLFLIGKKKHQWVSWGGPLHHHQPAFGKFRMHHFEGQPMELRLRLHVQEATKDLPDFVGVSFWGQGNNGKKNNTFRGQRGVGFLLGNAFTMNEYIWYDFVQID